MRLLIWVKSFGRCRFMIRHNIFLEVVKPLIVVLWSFVESELLMLLYFLVFYTISFLDILGSLFLLEICKPVLKKIISCWNLLDLKLSSRLAWWLHMIVALNFLTILARSHGIIGSSFIYWDFSSLKIRGSSLPKNNSICHSPPFCVVFLLLSMIANAIFTIRQFFSERVFFLA